MNVAEDLAQYIFNVHDEEMFEKAALKVFSHQFEKGAVYRHFCLLLGRNPSNVRHLNDIPFMPAEFFREFRIISGELPADHIAFESSGTTEMIASRHYVGDVELYKKSLLAAFRQFWGEVSDYRILALLPGYLERPSSSLVYMMRQLIALTGDPASGFYLNEYDALHDVLHRSLHAGRKTMLFGVSHALLDFAEDRRVGGPGLIVVETGGMKGRRREMVREELHARLRSLYGVEHVSSEYGMTELLSQAWSVSAGLFKCPPWMRVLIRDPNDPFGLMPDGRTGGINVIDLANLNSCSFIATQDLGRLYADGSFEVLGRFDYSDLRGCNLLMSDGMSRN